MKLIVVLKSFPDSVFTSSSQRALHALVSPSDHAPSSHPLINLTSFCLTFNSCVMQHVKHSVKHPSINPWFFQKHPSILSKSYASIHLSIKSKNPCFHLLFTLLPNTYPFPPPSIPPSISGLFANQTPSVLPSPTCQEQLPAALLTTLLTTSAASSTACRPAAATTGRTSPTRATASFTGSTNMCNQWQQKKSSMRSLLQRDRWSGRGGEKEKENVKTSTGLSLNLSGTVRKPRAK